MRWAVVVLAGGFGCYAPSFQDCELACGANDSCPADQTCVGGRCRDNGKTGSCTAVEIDAPMTIDAPPGAMWSTPQDLGIGLGYSDPSLINTQRELYLAKDDFIYVSVPEGSPPTFGTPTALPEFTAVGPTVAPYVSFDGLLMYVTRNNGANAADVYVTTRPQGIGAFGNIMNVAALNSASNDSGGSTTSNAQMLVFGSNRTVNSNVDLYVSTFNAPAMAWRPPNPLGALNHATANDTHPALDGSGRTIVFASDRGGNYDLYIATRANDTDPFDPPVPLVELNSNTADKDPWISADGQTIYFVRGIGAVSRIMRSTRL